MERAKAINILGEFCGKRDIEEFTQNLPMEHQQNTDQTRKSATA